MRPLHRRPPVLRDMHQNCEYGIAAHWGYKEGGKQDLKYGEKIAWLRQILEFKDEEGGDAGDFIDQFKSEVFADRVYVLTPHGKVVDLPKGSTALDFAYHIHTEVGNHYCGAKADGRIIPIAYELQNGQSIEILTSKHSSPSRDWLNPQLGYIKSSRTRAKIRSWFKQLDFDRNVEDGRALLDKELHRLGIHQVKYEQLLKRYNAQKIEDLYAALGRGEITTVQISSALQDQILVPASEKAELPSKISYLRKTGDKQISPSGLQIMGVGDLMSRLAQCCKPLPYDEITGYITRGKGVTVHKNDCPNLMRLRATEKERLVAVAWGESSKDVYPVDIVLKAFDRQGLLKDITNILSNEHLNVVGVNTRTDKKTHIANMSFSLEVNDIAQLSKALVKIEQLPNVMEVAQTNKLTKELICMRKPLFKHIGYDAALLAAFLLLLAVCSAAVSAPPVDSDKDGITDIDEAKIYKTDSQLADTDTDGLPDGLEINEYFTDPLLTDTDGDGFLDGVEVRNGSDPTDPSSIPNSGDLDGDGIPNDIESNRYKTDPQRPDTDFDGLTDLQEIQDYFTNPLAVDSDGDGVWDGEEVKAGRDPTNPDSVPR